MLGDLASVEVHFQTNTSLLGEITALWWPFFLHLWDNVELSLLCCQMTVHSFTHSSIHWSIPPSTIMLLRRAEQTSLYPPAVSSTTSFKCFLDLSRLLFVPVTLPQEVNQVSLPISVWGNSNLTEWINFSPGQREWDSHPEVLGFNLFHLLYGHFPELMTISEG